MELYNQTAASLAKMLQNKECSSVEATQSVLDRIAAVEDTIGAFVAVTGEEALRRAKEIDDRRASGEELPPLAGVPVAIKDNICTKDVKTTCSSKMLENFVPPYNATVMERLNREGAVMVGKLNMDEFAMGSSCETSYFKKTKNPHNPEYVPGGSSGGSAAAVAAGEAFVSLGSDTGGSIRLPASYCGVIGLKPTYGSVSRYGLVAFASSLDQIGPFGRSVADVAMTYSAICGHDPYDATSANRAYPQFTVGDAGDMKGKVIGIPKEYFGLGVSADVHDRVMKAAELFEKNGAVLKEVSLPSTPYALSAYYIISSAEASSNLARFDGVKYGYRTPEFENLTDLYEKTRSEGFGDEVKRRILLGTFVLSSGYYDAYYKRAKLLQKQIQQEFSETFSSCDLLLTPTGTDTAFKLGEKESDPLSMYANDICTVTVNIAGLPAISVPCGNAANGLPVGMQLIAPKFEEQRLFTAAGCYEALTEQPLCPVASL
ncbi:Asp-tRNA(Asn)/Glu-tRNA(Gln) amidotransferase subunit GatA [Phocea massiliensis]|uniref:Glutamyl-tRNA(Gln) amidotransferase subunit A n=1 Tax=Merdimmobilis hominis TaxID=2897707 RepID=A0A939BDR8_9FIRM|nr:Asp-tRNA(Asn)/Glu-tRNA(Gln) amidotransferase subunit GatA [Merdimmobilis hominis]MBM6919738.1 Asp-tRNA(Asn)/Glu-tRNA(Gln) amidotransferase subunit GatA [Merdimmobilis hominis]